MNKKVGNYYVDVTSEKYLLTVCDLLDKDSNWNYGRMLDTKEEAIEHIDTLESLNISDFLVKITVVYFNKYGYPYPGKVILRKKLKNNKIKESKIMNKKIIRLTESDLHRIVKESVGKVLRESRPLPASKEEFKRDRDSLLAIKRHLEEYSQGLNGYSAEGEPYEYAINTCITCVDRAIQIMDKTILFTTNSYSTIPNHWGADNVTYGDENNDNINDYTVDN